MGDKEIKGIIFDLDGTLLDTLEDLKNAVNAALKMNNLPTRSLEEVRAFVGNGIKNLIIRAVEGGKENPAFDKVFADFKEYYGIHCKDNTCPYPGISELLEILHDRNIPMAIVSNKIDSAVKALNVEHFKGYMVSAIGEMEGIARKPAPDMVDKAISEMNIPRENLIYVGDSDVDIMTAKNSDLRCISVTWGFRDRDFLIAHGATNIIDKPEQILNYL